MKSSTGNIGAVWNWSRTASCTPASVSRPRTLDELRGLLFAAAKAGRTVRAVGARHSPGDIFCTDGDLIDLAAFNKVVSFHRESAVLEVEAGMPLHDINRILASEGLALPSLGSISDQTIAGAIGTGTHGTGIGFGALHSSVVGVDVLLANGDLRTIDAATEPALLEAFRLGLGALGVVVRVRLAAVPLFSLETVVEEHRLEDALRDLDADVARHDHFKLLLYPHTGMAKKWMARRGPPTGRLEHTGKTTRRERLVDYHALELLLTAAGSNTWAVERINRLYAGTPGRVHAPYRGLSYNVFNFDCLFRQHVNEWSVPVERAADVLRELDRRISERRWPAHFPIEVRFTRRDETWLSPAYQRDACHIGIIMYRPHGREIERADYWKSYEELMRANRGRPHWAKTFEADAAYLASVFPKLGDFLALRQSLDPGGLFLNAYLRRHFDVKELK